MKTIIIFFLYEALLVLFILRKLPPRYFVSFLILLNISDMFQSFSCSYRSPANKARKASMANLPTNFTAQSKQKPINWNTHVRKEKETRDRDFETIKQQQTTTNNNNNKQQQKENGHVALWAKIIELVSLLRSSWTRKRCKRRRRRDWPEITKNTWRLRRWTKQPTQIFLKKNYKTKRASLPKSNENKSMTPHWIANNNA